MAHVMAKTQIIKAGFAVGVPYDLKLAFKTVVSCRLYDYFMGICIKDLLLRNPEILESQENLKEIVARPSICRFTDLIYEDLE